MAVAVLVCPTTQQHSSSASHAHVLPLPGGSAQIIYRVPWGLGDDLQVLFSRVMQAAPICQRNGVDVVQVVGNSLSSHFVTLLATPSARGALRGMVIRCFKPSTYISLAVSHQVMTNLITRGATYQSTFQAAMAANAHIRISDGSRTLAVY